MKLSTFIQTFTCVKSIITISLTACFVYLCITGSIDSSNFMSIYTMIIGFYFGTQWQKKQESKEENKK